MKTIKILSILLLAGVCSANAQATQAINAITSTSYLGTSNNFDVVFKRQAVSSGLLSTNKTSFGLNSMAMPNSVSLGVGAGQYSSGTGSNTYIGQNAGMGQSLATLNSGNQNTFLGNNSGQKNTIGSGNVFLGSYAGVNNSSGDGNIFIGSDAGNSNNIGRQNLYIGHRSGYDNETGIRNVFLGIEAGSQNSGSNNIFLGYYAGYEEFGNDKLYIENSASETPIIWGDFALDQLKFNAKVGIGNSFGNYPTTAGSVDVSAYNLFVKGGILTEEVRISQLSTWADYVFAKDYKLPTLLELEDFIAKNGHLPNVPSAQQVKEDGIALGEMAKIQQEKIEELTLYIIEQNKVNEVQNKEIQELKRLVETLINKK